MSWLCTALTGRPALEDNVPIVEVLGAQKRRGCVDAASCHPRFYLSLLASSPLSHLQGAFLRGWGTFQ